MAQIASWGPKAFGVDSNKIVPLVDLKVSMSVKGDSQGDSSGTSQTNLQGREPEVVSLATQYLRGTGSDPWVQVEEWRSLQGKTHPLYIGGKQFGENQFTLKSAEVSDVLLSNSGDFLGIKVSFTFEETVVKVKEQAKKEKTYFGGSPYDSLSVAEKQELAVKQRRAGTQVPNPNVYVSKKNEDEYAEGSKWAGGGSIGLKGNYNIIS